MILASHGIIASQIASFDADAVAFFNRVTTAGGTLSTTEKQAVNQLVLDLKANSLWTPMKAIYPMVGASAAACAQNLKSSSFTGTFTSGWTFASTGATPNGTSAYFDTGLNANTNLSQNSTHLSYYSRTNISAGQVDMGITTTTGTSTYLLFSYSGTGFSGINAAEAARTSAANPTTGLLIGSRNSSSQEKYFTNNVSQTRTATSVSIASFNIYLGCYNNMGTALFFSSKQCAFSSIGDGLTDTQASNFYTAVQTFQTTLSRQV
jgi:hypothetical protein